MINLSPSSFDPIVDMYFPEPHASLLKGMLLGIDLKHLKGFSDNLKHIGLIHVVVLSGSNISILLSFCSVFTRFFGKQISTLIGMGFIVLFVLFVRPQAPLIRAALLGIFTSVSLLYGRRSYTLIGLLVSLIIIAFLWPQWLTSPSLHLSYAATFGLIIFPKTKIQAHPFLSFLWTELTTTLAAQLFTTPIIMYNFHQVSLISPLSNILISFTITPIMIFGFATILFGSIHYLAGILPALITYGLLEYFVIVVNTLSKLPFIFLSF